MKYSNVVKGRFLERPNRFVAIVEIEGENQKVHVKNTGRCKELLIENAEVYLEDFVNDMRNRKLRYSLIGVKKGNLMINMDSQVPNKVVKEALEEKLIELPNMEKITFIKPEKTYLNSRLDFYVEDENKKRGFIEVKGVTLEEEGVVKFPDAPTERGTKHLEHLIEAKRDGYEAYVIFLVQMEEAKYFTPNYKTDPKFAKTLIEAEEKGVHILSYSCKVFENEITLNKKISVVLSK